MKGFPVAGLVSAMGALCSLKGFVSEKPGNIPTAIFNPLQEQLKALADVLEEHKMKASINALANFRTKIRPPVVTSQLITSMLTVLETAIMADLDHKAFLVHDINRIERLVETENQLPAMLKNWIAGADAEVSEALKCMVFQRPTAAVFHCMRAVEAGVDQIIVKLQVSSKGKTWFDKLSDIETKVKTLSNADEKQRWNKTIIYLHQIKNVWRNPTMHGGGIIDYEEAESIVWASVSFLKLLLPKLA